VTLHPFSSRLRSAVFLLALVLLSACAPRAPLIAAGVSATLTALAPTAILPADRATSTAVPTLAPPAASPTPGNPPASEAPASEATATDTSASVTSTSVTSASAISASATPANAEATPAPTEPPTQAAPAPTAAPAAAPASVTAGDLMFQDSFDSAGLWSVGETDSSSVSVAGGLMTFTQKTAGGFSVRIVGRKGSDFYAEVTAALADRCASGDRYGLMFRAQDLSNFYALQVNCDGQYRLVRYSGGAAAPIIDWTPSDVIQRGRQSANTLAVIARGAEFQVIINNTPLASASDASFADGRFGLMVGANITRNFTVLFDNLKANKLS
jgi:hypothetical protein